MATFNGGVELVALRNSIFIKKYATYWFTTHIKNTKIQKFVHGVHVRRWLTLLRNVWRTLTWICIYPVDLNNDGAKDLITANGSLWWYQNKITQLPSGTKNETFQTISVYPNPVADEINIDELSDKIYFLTVINSVGQEVLNSTLEYGKANVKSLSSGQYVIVIRDESGKKVGQQIILKQ